MLCKVRDRKHETDMKATSYIPIYIQQDATLQFIHIWKLLYMFLVVPPPIIRSAYNCIYSIWYLPHHYCHLSLLWRSWKKVPTPPTSGICHTVTAICCFHRGAGTKFQLLQHLVFATPLLLSAAFMEELEQSSNSSNIWYLSHHYCYLPLSWRSWNKVPTPPTSGICHTVTAICHFHGGAGTKFQLLQHLVFVTPDVIDTVVCTADDGRRYHLKHVEQFPDINKLCEVASCWIYIGI